MSYRKYIYTLISLYLCSLLHVISADEGCDKSKCKGPLKYYEDLQCTPIYSLDTCCPAAYNCDHLQGRSKDKCHYKGHVYNIDETLRVEDAKPCDIGCVCKEGLNNVAQFQCAVVDCFLRAKPDCYLKKSHTQCCDEPEVCPQEVPDLAKCEVDGKTYFDGQRFTPSSDPTLSCICGAGYTGENVSPFCKPIEPHSCGVELRRVTDIYDNCSPAFYTAQNPATDCNVFSRCQNPDDTVESQGTTETGDTPLTDPTPVCSLGNLVMNLGDKLDPKMDNGVCLKCECDVPPLLTCKQVADNLCPIPSSRRVKELEFTK